MEVLGLSVGDEGGAVGCMMMMAEMDLQGNDHAPVNSGQLVELEKLPGTQDDVMRCALEMLPAGSQGSDNEESIGRQAIPSTVVGLRWLVH